MHSDLADNGCGRWPPCPLPSTSLQQQRGHTWHRHTGSFEWRIQPIAPSLQLWSPALTWWEPLLCRGNWQRCVFTSEQMWHVCNIHSLYKPLWFEANVWNLMNMLSKGYLDSMPPSWSLFLIVWSTLCTWLAWSRSFCWAYTKEQGWVEGHVMASFA